MRATGSSSPQDRDDVERSDRRHRERPPTRRGSGSSARVEVVGDLGAERPGQLHDPLERGDERRPAPRARRADASGSGEHARPRARGYGSSRSHREHAQPLARRPWPAPIRPSGSSADSTMRATVPTSKRTSPPPTSEPRSMSTTPNRPSPARQSATERPVPRLEHLEREHLERHERARRAGTSAARSGAPARPSSISSTATGTRAPGGRARRAPSCRRRRPASSSSTAAASSNAPTDASTSAAWPRSAAGSSGNASRSCATQRASGGAAGDVGLLQVREHAQEDLTRSASARGTPAGTPASEPCSRAKSARAPSTVEDRAGVERVDEDVGRRRRPRRGSDRASRRRGARSPIRRADLDHQDAERDRDAEAAVDDVGEEGVAGVGVVERVAGEAPVDEQVAGRARRASVPRRTRVGRELVEAGRARRRRRARSPPRR